MMDQAELTRNDRARGGMVGARGRRRALQLAVEAEAERQREAAALLRDLGHQPSHAERVIVEQLSTLIVRGRRLRQAGRGADAEMVARLILRGVTKLGVRQGPAQAPGTTSERIAAKIAARRPVEGRPASDPVAGTGAATPDRRTDGLAAPIGGGAP